MPGVPFMNRYRRCLDFDQRLQTEVDVKCQKSVSSHGFPATVTQARQGDSESTS